MMRPEVSFICSRNKCRTKVVLVSTRENQRKAGMENVEFLKGEIEHIPLPDNSVDVVISNCVINLQNMLLWVGCIAGALDSYQYAARLGRAAFAGINIEPTRVYDIEDARTFLTGQGVDVDAIAPQVEGKFMSAVIRATKPASCCAPDCCA
jgi:arsenite methyltransferase